MLGYKASQDQLYSEKDQSWKDELRMLRFLNRERQLRAMEEKEEFKDEGPQFMQDDL